MKKTNEKIKNGITELVFILDRSGSMGGLESDTIGGFNSLLEKQKKQDGSAFVTTVLFDNELETLHDRVPLEQVKLLTNEDYYVRGCTALYDAVGKTIEHIDNVHKYIRREDVPENVLFVIITDGLENASRAYDVSRVKRLISAKEELKWEFLFIGANIDSAETAGSIGIKRENAVDYHADSQGTEVVFKAVSRAVGKARCSVPLDAGWCAEIAEDYKNRK